MDAAKAPGYRGTTVCSPVSSKSSTTPPSLPSLAQYSSYSPPAQSPAHSHAQYAQYYPAESATTVTASRLNPRAPDFSTRAPTTLPQYMHPAMTHNVISYPPQATMGKYPPQPQPQPVARPASQTQQTQRWPFLAHSFSQPPTPDMYHPSLATLASLSHQGLTETVLASLENGTVSPSSPQHNQAPMSMDPSPTSGKVSEN